MRGEARWDTVRYLMDDIDDMDDVDGGDRKGRPYRLCENFPRD